MTNTLNAVALMKTLLPPNVSKDIEIPIHELAHPEGMMDNLFLLQVNMLPFLQAFKTLLILTHWPFESLM